MTERKTVPVAYVTKYATTRGILVWKGAEVSEDGYLYRRGKWTTSASAKHWTTDKAEAEVRYIAALKKKEKSLMQGLKSVRQELSDGPRFEDES